MSAKQGVRAATVWGRVATGASVLTASLMLCGFTKPQLPETIYDGARYSALLSTYKHAYAAVGMTSAKIAIEAQNRGADGATLTILTLSLSCPKSRKASEAPCSAEFSIRAVIKGDICHDCRVTRTSYAGDPTADEKASREIRKTLGKSVPALDIGWRSIPN